MVADIDINDYDYPLPDERIAKFPLERRDDSALLVNLDGNYKKEMRICRRK